MTVPSLNVGLATILPGAEPFKFENNVNPTYRGRFLIGGDEIRLGFIKDLDSKQLANELFASALAIAAGLPVPKPYLGFVANGDLPIKAAPIAANGDGHYVFASADAQTPALWQCYDAADETAYDDACRKLAAWAQAGLMYGFDSWIANTDRHQGNLLFEGSKVYLIDHGHAFAGPNWQVADLIPEEIFSNKIKQWLTPYIPDGRKAKLLAEAMAVASLANDNLLGEAGGGSNFANFLGDGEGSALVNFLKARGPHLAPIIADALDTAVGAK